MLIENIKAMLRKDEGLRLKRYLCTKKHWTIGYGWNLDANPLPADIAVYEKQHGEITLEMAERLLDVSVQEAVKETKKIYPDIEAYSDSRQLALVDFVYNVGQGTAMTFLNTNAAIRERRWEDAAHGFEHSAWYHQVGNRAVRLVKMIREG